MKIVPELTLERITLVKIATIFCDQDDIRNLLRNDVTRNAQLHGSEEWKRLEYRVKRKVQNFLIPESLREKICGCIRPIGLQISKWMKYHCGGQSNVQLPLPAKFCWTPHGVMDKKKTAELLIKEENLDAKKCYELACIYSLEEDIPVLWSKLPKEYTQSPSIGGHMYPGDFESYLIHYWTSKMKGEQFFGFSPFDYIFDYNIEFGLLSSIKYFFNALHLDERKELLENYSSEKGSIDVFLYLLSEMNEEDQLEVIEDSTFSMLERFLHWPLQSLFLLTVDYAWDFFSYLDVMLLLQKIIWKQDEGYRDYDYPALFRGFWEKIPKELKDDFINGLFGGHPSKFQRKDKVKQDGRRTRYYCSNFRILLFVVKQENILKTILQDFSPEEKMKIILSDGVRGMCQHFINSDRWDSIEYFVKECLLSDEEKVHFKWEFEERNNQNNLFAPEDRRHKWEQLFGLSDSVNKLGEKRSINELVNSVGASSSKGRTNCK